MVADPEMLKQVLAGQYESFLHRPVSNLYVEKLVLFSLYSQMNPVPRKLILAKICPGTVSLPVSDHDPTDSHLLDPKSHQEHRHTHTDACSYTECALNRKMADLIFRNRKTKNPRKFILSAFQAICEKLYSRK